VVPSVSFSAVDLTRVVSTLSDLSVEYDPSPGPERGVNIVVIDPQNQNPSVSITLRNLSLKRVLDVITDSVGYQYEVQSDLIVVRPGGETSTLDTAFFPVTRSTVIRMTGIGAAATGGGSLSNDPFASPPPASAGGAPGGEGAALRAFLQQAGVNFDGVPGSSLAYDGSAMIVTQTTRNIERIRNILNRYNDVRQVEIEAKFMEVQEGALEELGVQWGISRRGVPVTRPDGTVTFVPRETYTTAGVNRTLSDAFASTVGGSTLSIESREVVTPVPDGSPIISPGISRSIPFAAPAIPGSAPLGTLAGPFANITGMVGEFDVNAVIRALSQKAGSDLLSAPKVTVLSGNPATIVVAQELRYPQSYGEIQSQVGSGTRETSSAGVTITAGTPQDFTHRNVGVELQVTPTVEEDDYSISLDLAPKVTEFEGFVEYGGTSVAISGGTTVTVPAGFYQPIFSVRELTTKVTIWDGATLVMGGLTREEVKKVHDKVPILGDIPLIGRAFRSQGESSQKRNLLIFVTANLVSPGGSPKNQSLRSVAPSSMFQNPTIVTPASAEPRVRGN
jgi:general secretion pathway protein D